MLCFAWNTWRRRRRRVKLVKLLLMYIAKLVIYSYSLIFQAKQSYYYHYYYCTYTSYITGYSYDWLSIELKLCYMG